MMVQDQSRVPADLRDIWRATCHHGPRRSSASARVQQQQHQQQARHDARERAQPTKLDLFRSCSDTDAAAVDLEADIPPAATVVRHFNATCRTVGAP
jgi:hypothetical protein